MIKTAFILSMSLLSATAPVAPVSNTTLSASSDWDWEKGCTTPTNNLVYESKYDLLDKAIPGDLIYENQGEFAKFVGHVMIVDSIQEYQGQKYVRIIEAVSSGVSYGIVDDVRFSQGQDVILNVGDLTSEQRTQVVNFATLQLGKAYSFDYFVHHSSVDSKNWYCSELGWASYLSVGINTWDKDKMLEDKKITNYTVCKVESLISPCPTAILNSKIFQDILDWRA